MPRRGRGPSPCRTGGGAQLARSAPMGRWRGRRVAHPRAQRRRPRVDLDVEPGRGDRHVPGLRARGPGLQPLAAPNLHLRRDRPAARAPERARPRHRARLGCRPGARRSRRGPVAHVHRCGRCSRRTIFRSQHPTPARPAAIPTASPISPSPPARPASPSASCTRTTRCSPTRATWCATGGTGPTRCCSASRRCPITSPGWAWRSGCWRGAGS